MKNQIDEDTLLNNLCNLTIINDANLVKLTKYISENINFTLTRDIVSNNLLENKNNYLEFVCI